ncbi:hypothetical protein QF001_001766 [Paraburkholderia youngii]|uniref:BPSL0761 family protein n=1 Tax=Paraburkholderia youngii TaxID=2782701 RepID=UPI003D1E5C77
MIPYERTQAVLRTHDLLKRLAAGERLDAETLRHHALALLKHFPQPVDVDLSTDVLPSIWARMDAKWARLGYTRTSSLRGIERRASRNRRKLVRKGALLLPVEFCRQKGISREELARRERSGDVFGVEIEGQTYYPAVLADKSLEQQRLVKLLRHLGPRVPPMARYLLLVNRRSSLGGKTPLQALRRGRRFRLALRIADNLSDEYRTSQL